MNLGRNVGDDASALAENRRRLESFLPARADVADSGSRRRRRRAHRKLAARAESGRRCGGHARSGRGLRGPHRRLPAGAAGRRRRQRGRHRACRLARARRGRARSDDNGTRRSRRRARTTSSRGSVPRSVRIASKSAPTCAIDSARTIPPPRRASRRNAPASGTPTSLRSRERVSRAPASRSVTGGGHCTHSDAARFFSYRRERDTGRMATAIWLARD